MKKLLLVLIILSAQGHAHTSLLTPVDFGQSTSSLDWKVINNSAVKVVYPDYMEGQAQFVTNLVDFYSHKVGLTYGIKKPQQFPLILRPEFAELNGFVTLMPRRSEWYTSATITPVIGGLNFYQALSIHEYRHINQYDFLKQSTNKFAYAAFGEFGLSLAYFLGIPPWYFEGDAVWAETKYTDSGRGRSPRFAARLKALVLGDKVPSYDEFLAKTYNTKYPNHYVFGFYILSAGYNKYGEDFWSKVLSRVANFSFNPYAITNAFRAETGIDFEDFYNQMMADLKKSWNKPNFKKSNAEYSEKAYPIIDGDRFYYAQTTLDSQWSIYRYGKNSPEVELPIFPALSKIDIKNNIVAYTQYLPSARFGFKSYSDLFTYDLNNGDKKHILKDTRVFHPSFSPDGSKIAVVYYDSTNHWFLKVVDLDGTEIQKLALNKEIVSEVTWKNEQELIAIVQRIDGYKRIKEIDLIKKSSRVLLEATRNNLFALRYANGSVYFEADYKGAVQIMALNTSNATLSKCTDETIAAYNPFASDKKLYFISEQASGHELRSIDLNCQPLRKSTLEGFDYLGDTPSDNYAKLPIQKMPNFESIVSQKHSSTEYSEFTDKLSPHSWSFVSGRGIDLSITGDNYLNSLGYTVGVGRGAEEEKPFAYASISYKKYYPIFTLSVDYRQRDDEDNVTKIRTQWEELEGDLSITLPYMFKKGFYNNYLELTGRYGLLKYTRNQNAKVYEVSDERLDISGGEVVISSLKDKTSRQLYPSYGASYIGVYQDAKAKDVKNFSSNVFYQNLDVYLPGFFTNTGFKFSGSMEKQTKGTTNYRFEPIGENFTSYVLSRGYKYSYIDQYQKGSVDYLFPIAYPDWDLNGWAFLRRIYAKAFFDHTKVELFSRELSLNSTGAELLLETYLLRKFDFTFGVRGSYKLDDRVSDKEVYDFFIASGLGF